MSALAETFTRLRAEGRKALLPFFTAGYPSERIFQELLAAAAGAGADAIEIGIPFSDPLADGPAIQYSSGKALAGGMSLSRALELLAQDRKVGRPPLVLMTYTNPVMRLGWRSFAERAAGAGAAGVIVPDLPLEEGAELERELAERGLDLVYLAAPTTGDDRLRELARRSRGFLYLVSVTGVTGARGALPPDLAGFVTRARRATRLPLCLGFGISTREQAAEAGRLVDGIIVGSAIVERVRDASGPTAAAAAVSSFLLELREGLDGEAGS